MIPQPQGHCIGIHSHTSAARGRHDAAPVGVPAMHRTLHQRGTADCAGDGASGGIIARTLHLHFHEAGGSLTITGDGFGQVLRHRRQAGLQCIEVLGVQGLTGCKRQVRVVGAGVAVHRDRIKRAIHRPLHHRLPNLRWHSGIAAEVAEHGGHVRVDHSRALRHAANPHGAATELRLQGDLLVGEIGCEDGTGGRSTTAWAEGFKQWIEACQQCVHWDRHADHAGGADQHLVCREPQALGHGLSSALAINQAAIACAGIGLAGIGEHGPGSAATGMQPFSAEIHAGGAHQGGGEGAGTHSPLGSEQQREIRLAGGLETSGDAGSEKSLRGRDAARDGVPGLRHGRRFLQDCCDSER